MGDRTVVDPEGDGDTDAPTPGSEPDTGLANDGGEHAPTLNKAQFDVLRAVARFHRADKQPVGRAVLTLVRQHRDIDGGDFYRYLDWLADHGLVEVEEFDGRTNLYRPTEAGRQVIEREAAFTPAGADNGGDRDGE